MSPKSTPTNPSINDGACNYSRRLARTLRSASATLAIMESTNSFRTLAQTRGASALCLRGDAPTRFQTARLTLDSAECNNSIPKGISNYNGMVVSFQHRFGRWGQGVFQANYTYGHALDEVSNGGTAPFSNWARQPFTVNCARPK